MRPQEVTFSTVRVLTVVCVCGFSESHRIHTTIMAENEPMEYTTEHERILQEIESTDTACVGPTLR